MNDASGPSIDEYKQETRLAARARRKATTDRHVRSANICGRLRELPEVAAADRVLAYLPMGSEVDVGEFVAWCRSVGKQVRVPEDEMAADWPDVILVPGLSFTPDGRRLGQGAGWYDRFLPGRRDDCVTIGVAFSTQLVDDLPTEPHDIPLDLVVTD